MLSISVAIVTIFMPNDDISLQYRPKCLFLGPATMLKNDMIRLSGVKKRPSGARVSHDIHDYILRVNESVHSPDHVAGISFLGH